MAGPIDCRVNPTKVNELAVSKPYAWFEKNLISAVPLRHPSLVHTLPWTRPVARTSRCLPAVKDESATGSGAFAGGWEGRNARHADAGAFPHFLVLKTVSSFRLFRNQICHYYFSSPSVPGWFQSCPNAQRACRSERGINHKTKNDWHRNDLR